MPKPLTHAALAPLLGLVALLFSAAPAGGQESPLPASPAHAAHYLQVIEHYSAVRLALTEDRVTGVAERGARIQELLRTLEDRASREGGLGPELRPLMPLLSAAAADLAAASSLEEARDAFYGISKPLVRWRKAADPQAQGPEVYYCSMTRRSWLQPAGEVANPYHGSSMLRCGENVGG
ncbi:MAG: hypothetical protein AAF725_04175 [Acidobacteriota bacterium]